MKLSIFTTYSSGRHDHLRESLHCYSDLADEVIVIDGSGDREDGSHNQYGWKNVRFLNYKWPQEFSFEFIGQQFQHGYDACTGDWVIRMDLDYFFHEDDFKSIRDFLENLGPKTPACSFLKYQFILPDRYNIKARPVIAFNKALLKDTLKLDGGGDLCQPTIGGNLLTNDDVPASGIALYNYDHCFKDAPTLSHEIGRMNRAYYRRFGKWVYGEDGQHMHGFMNMIKGRLQNGQEKVKIEFHPKYVRRLIEDMKPEQLGWNAFNFTDTCDYYKEKNNV